ncbi:cobalamin-binding protein [Marinimicrobium koreense]|jgi:iron complex transport system substrate-binding protein|uniref:cobalamin-binding protein n=1 Tax=Marinimicrobium koreense TaxID=306545 RepID=UPI003F70F6C6
MGKRKGLFRRFLTAFILLLGLSLGLHALAQVQVTDDLGREIILEQPAKRLIALAPHIVENVYSAGAGDRLLAAVDYSDYPPEAQKLPPLGSAQSVSVEAVVALEPDLVLMWATGNSRTLRQQLERLGINVYVDEPRTLEDVARSVRSIGALTGTGDSAEQAAQRHLNRLAELRAQYSERTPVSVLYQVWHQPLQTLNGEHLVSDVIRLCGGRNVYADAKPLAPTINMESVLERDPQVIVASGMGEERPDWLNEWKSWSELTAVQRDNLFFVPPDLIQRHTLRILDGAELFCRHIDRARQRLSDDP